MVELDGDLVVKHVAPETESRVIILVHVVRVEQFLDGGHETSAHQWELVIDKTSIETSNKGTGDGSDKDKSDNSVSSTLEALQGRVVEGSSQRL